MKRIRRLKNPVQTYAWGSTTAIPSLLGRENPDNAPWAELWMGAHPKAPSMLETDGGWASLQAVIQESPDAILGRRIAQTFGGRLPFLFKVLAAAAPLSIQAHPNKVQAEKGFEAENRLGIPLDAPNRNYRDDNHKPECICAIEPFLALCGFRRIPDILKQMGALDVWELKTLLEKLTRQPDKGGLKVFYHELMSMPPEARSRLVAKAVEGSKNLLDKNPAFEWVVHLDAAYPGDIGALSPLLLNLVQLEPGQALFLPAGELHAYLEGVGIELMANSDNVLRGGLTPKHVDVAELMAILNFEERDIQILRPCRVSDVESIYPTPATEFDLSRICLTDPDKSSFFKNDGLQILLCIGGEATLAGPHQEDVFRIEKGDSVLVPAGVDSYRILGRAEFFMASTPPGPHGPDLTGRTPEPL